MSINELIQLASKFRHQGNLQRAENIYKEILNFDPINLHAIQNLANILQDRGQIDECMFYHQRAIDINPNDFGAYYNLADAFFEKGEIDQAILNYKKALKINPNFQWAHNNLGLALKDIGQIDEAITHFRKAIELSPYFVLAINNLGNALQYKGKLQEALGCYKKSLEIEPNIIDAYFNMGLILLTLGNLKEGWKNYEYRWGTKEFITSKRTFLKPTWNGFSLKGKQLFIYAEQGVGDEIMFASCFPDVINQAELCIIECDKRLIPIFARSFPGTTIIERIGINKNAQSALPPFDIVIATGSLPLYFRSAFSSFPKSKAYLIPDPEKINKWLDRFKTLGKGLRIGISWRGGKDPLTRKIRSTNIEQWKKIFSLSGIHYINLQYGDCKENLKEIKEKLGITIHDWEDANPLIDLDNFTSQVAALDLVISVDNATVHMAGALGVAVWTLLPFVPDWRWMLNREDSPWYPMMRLFRQPSLGDWNSVIEKVAEELQKLISSKP